MNQPDFDGPSKRTRLRVSNGEFDRLTPARQLQVLHDLPLGSNFPGTLEAHGMSPLRARAVEVLQVNVGKVCNQTCRHCHVDAGPDRPEMMSRETLELCLDALDSSGIPVVDITGGAPEMCPDFRWFVAECRKLGRHVIDRCNLTILETRPHHDLPEFLAEHEVEVIASLPHFRALNTDRQRGDGVFDKSIRALRHLNDVGYGKGGPLRLNLVTNPVGAFLPGNQASLEREWKRELEERHGLSFDALYTITNMPISRYLEWLRQSGNLEAYMARLVRAFNPNAARQVMCRTTLSVAWDGSLYDCDFNQMLELPVESGVPRHIRDFDAKALAERRIVLDTHCFGCTAGAGSSCGGSTA
jgi:radical SAM/Cys-rich protein